MSILLRNLVEIPSVASTTPFKVDTSYAAQKQPTKLSKNAAEGAQSLHKSFPAHKPLDAICDLRVRLRSSMPRRHRPRLARLRPTSARYLAEMDTDIGRTWSNSAGRQTRSSSRPSVNDFATCAHKLAHRVRSTGICLGMLLQTPQHFATANRLLQSQGLPSVPLHLIFSGCFQFFSSFSSSADISVLPFLSRMGRNGAHIPSSLNLASLPYFPPALGGAVCASCMRLWIRCAILLEVTVEQI